jgi:hypothetical protein
MTGDRPSRVVTGPDITDMLVIQSAMLLRLSRMEFITLDQIGEVMGDIGSLYLSLSEAIRSGEVAAIGEAAFPLRDGVWMETAHPSKSRLD